MRDGWIETSLGDVAEWWSGGTPKAREPKYYENGTIPWAVIADMNRGVIDSTNSHITEEALEVIGGRMAPVGSVLISMYASVGKSAIANIPLATNQAIAWGIPDQTRILPFYLFLVSQQLEKEISNLARGATQKNINRQMLREFTFQLPPLPEQRRIVDLMSEIDSYIEGLQRQLESAKRSRSAVLHELLTAGGDGWIETTFAEVFNIQQGKTLAISKLSGGSYPVYGANGVVGYFDEYNFDFPVTGLGCRGSCGSIYYINEKAFLANNVMAIWEKDLARIDSRFIPLALSKIDFAGAGALNGQVQPQITKQGLEPVPITIPPICEQKRIVDIINTIDEVISQTELTTSKAQNLRAGLLSDLLSGDHAIPNSYDKVMGAA